MKKAEKCVSCKVDVAPFDPERVDNKHGTFHGACWKEVKRIQEACDALRKAKQYNLKFSSVQ